MLQSIVFCQFLTLCTSSIVNNNEIKQIQMSPVKLQEQSNSSDNGRSRSHAIDRLKFFLTLRCRYAVHSCV